MWRTSTVGMHWTLVQIQTSIIWNGIGKGKYKLILQLWVGMCWNILTQKYAMSGLVHETIRHKYVRLQKHLEWNR